MANINLNNGQNVFHTLIKILVVQKDKYGGKMMAGILGEGC